MLTNEKFLPKQYRRYTYGIDQNPHFERMNYDYSSNPMFRSNAELSAFEQQARDMGFSSAKEMLDFAKAQKALHESKK